MKKILIFSLLMTVVLSGCSQNNAQSETKTSESNNNARQMRMPDFERPEEEPSLRGLVKSLVGNEATILELSMPNRDQNMEMEGETEIDDSEQAPVATFGAGTGGGPMPGGMGMPGGGNRQEGDSDDRLEMMKSMSTGEAKVTIPVGIKMLKNEDGEMVSATLTDVTADKMLMIWLNKDIEDRNVAEFVIIN